MTTTICLVCGRELIQVSLGGRLVGLDLRPVRAPVQVGARVEPRARVLPVHADVCPGPREEAADGRC